MGEAGTPLARILHSKGMSQQGFRRVLAARGVQVSTDRLHRMCAGATVPTGPELVQFGDALGVDPRELVELSGGPAAVAAGAGERAGGGGD